MGTVLEKDKYLDRSIDFCISDIFEYDMKRAGLSICKTENLLPPDKISRLEKMEKHKADVWLGTEQRTNKTLKEGLKEGFRKYRMLFGEMNELSDTDILSVKKDAIFTTKYCEYTDIGDYITFREKNHYEAYLYINNCECYWGPDGKLDIKGITDSNVALHQDYMNSFIWTFMKYLCQYDIDGARRYIVKFIDDYKTKKVPIGYYREFNSASEYTYVMYDQPTNAAHLDEVYKPLVIGNYNFLNVLVPLLNYVL